MVDDKALFELLVDNPKMGDKALNSVMSPPLPIVKFNTKIEAVSQLINKDVPAVLVELENGKHHIITRYDIIAAIA
jgi:cystathionine beta-synthase